MTTSITNQSHPPASLSIVSLLRIAQTSTRQEVFRSTLRRTATDSGNMLGVRAFSRRPRRELNSDRR
jgi:hypothetical protein